MKIDSSRPYHPNILTINGTGRNVGKTTLACGIIKKMAQNSRVTAIKITPHFHEVDYKNSLFEKSDIYAVYQEDRKDRNKDSSKMLAAGADRVWYVQTHDEYLSDLWDEISNLLNGESPVIIESGGIQNAIKPGYAILLTGDDQNKAKEINQRKYIKIKSDKDQFDSIIDRIEYVDGRWTFK